MLMRARIVAGWLAVLVGLAVVSAPAAVAATKAPGLLQVRDLRKR